MSELPFVGYSETRYELSHLQRLRDYLTANGNVISLSVSGFMSEMKSNVNPMVWVEFAERIKDDRDFPEKHFGNMSNPTTAHFSIKLLK